ncbi:MAG: anhydro-N-acetylmuramic acid kinase, partial [Gammaproteobacteria bacterium]|nr:anhydro-N-acetylmuramic acid kinase [Gammaproteobacteria bacterium]
SGFDTGPGNVLLDSWCYRKTGNSYDRNGDWAATGEISYSLLNTMLKEPYFSKPAPKSTGREHFNMDWLELQLTDLSIPNQDIQASLTELTARTIVDAINNYYPETERLILCGGGTHNKYLRNRIDKLSSDSQLYDTNKYGIAPDWVEAAAFAWLAHSCLNKIPANEPAVTGASSRVILGAIYPG